jgi:hypothetical protein
MFFFRHDVYELVINSAIFTFDRFSGEVLRPEHLGVEFPAACPGDARR